MRHETLICFDFGVQRIGVAVGQTITATATPLETIQVRNNVADWDRIAELIDQWHPSALVVGQPLNMDGSRQLLTDLAERFARQLEDRYHLPVHLADERLTTYEAKNRLRDIKNLDPVAAQVILESWLLEYTKISNPDVTMTDH
jgi:putative Holliday junction resolvase